MFRSPERFDYYPIIQWLLSWFHFRQYIYIYIYVVNFDVLAQASDFRIERRQIVYLCWMQDSNPEGLWNPIFSRLNACWQTDWAIDDEAKNLHSTALPYDQQAFSPPDPTAIWHSHLALAIYTFVVVNFDALAQASDFRIERRQVVFLCWMQDLNPEVSSCNVSGSLPISECYLQAAAQ